MAIIGSAIVGRIDIELKKIGEKRQVLVDSGCVKNTQTITNWLYRDTVPGADIALKIADYFGVSVRWLITGKDKKELTQDERNLLYNYQRLEEKDRKEIKLLIDFKLAVDSPEKTVPDPVAPKTGTYGDSSGQ